MFVRFGNFFNSEINGKIVSDQYPLGVKFVQNGMLSPHRAMALTEQTDAQEAYRLITHDPRYAEVLASIPYQHPAQLYEAFGYFCLFWVLWTFLSTALEHTFCSRVRKRESRRF